MRDVSTILESRESSRPNLEKSPVATAVLEDDSGKISLNLWRNQIDLVKEGDVVRIENGFVRTFRDQLELNVGSRGRIPVVYRS